MFLENTGLCILQEALEYSRSLPPGAVKVDVAGRERDEYFATTPCTGEENVETPLATLAGNGTKSHAVKTRARCARPVANGNENDIPLVALNVFEVLDEHILGLTFMEE